MAWDSESNRVALQCAGLMERPVHHLRVSVSDPVKLIQGWSEAALGRRSYRYAVARWSCRYVGVATMVATHVWVVCGLPDGFSKICWLGTSHLAVGTPTHSSVRTHCEIFLMSWH